jgi:hypothetical protein
VELPEETQETDHLQEANGREVAEPVVPVFRPADQDLVAQELRSCRVQVASVYNLPSLVLLLIMQAAVVLLAGIGR